MKNLEKKIILSSVIVLGFFLGLLAYSVFGLGIGLPTCVTTVAPFEKGKVIKKASGVYEVHMVAKMWSFEPAEINVPVGSILDIYLSTSDVAHGFHIEKTNVNLMAVPGTVNYARVIFDESGVYRVVCHEYCGFGHQNMMSNIIVGDEFQTKLLIAKMGRNSESSPESKGKGLLTTKGCIACHSLDGSVAAGPTFLGLYGKLEKTIDGKEVKVDEAYLIESIKQPNAVITKGFGPLMPILPVNDEEISLILAYLKTLKGK